MQEEPSKVEKYVKIGAIVFAVFTLIFSTVVTLYLKFSH